MAVGARNSRRLGGIPAFDSEPGRGRDMGPSRSSVGMATPVSRAHVESERSERAIRSVFGWDFRLSSGKTLRTTEVFEDYWRFACERQEIFHRRVGGAHPHWT